MSVGKFTGRHPECKKIPGSNYCVEQVEEKSKLCRDCHSWVMKEKIDRVYKSASNSVKVEKINRKSGIGLVRNLLASICKIIKIKK